MTSSNHSYRHRVLVVLLLCALIPFSGCSRRKYRLQADREAYGAIAERNIDPRWRVDRYAVEPDPRSRFFDPYDPDHSPMPPDDPVSHQYMHWVNGMKGWKHWHDNGDRLELENPSWRDAIAEYLELNEDGSAKLTLDSALRIAYLHSPSHQSQLEELYLSALDVTAERFRLDTQFFGGYDVRYAHDGSLIPAGLVYDPGRGHFVVQPPFDLDGAEINRLTIGRPFAADPLLQAQRRFATAGELLVGFANSFVFEFTGNDANLAASLANFSLVQPLLRGAGRDVALEQLTRAERALLANLRAYTQYRQGFYTQVAIGELGVGGPQRRGPSTSVTVFSGQGALGGYVGLLQQLQQIRNTEDNLSLQLRTLAQLEALLDVGVIDLIQVDQFRQSVENERSRLLRDRNAFELALDRYKTNTLGLPPDFPFQVDDGLIRQFQLVSRQATEVQDAIIALQDRVGRLPKDVGAEPIRRILLESSQVVQAVQHQLQQVESDLQRMEQAAADRESAMPDVDRDLFRQDRAQLRSTMVDLGKQYEQTVADLNGLQAALSEQTSDATARALVVWLSHTLRLVQRSTLVQARARLETVTIEPVDLSSRDAFNIAMANRLDFMNARAALVDNWRLIQFDADRLQSVLNVTASGDIRTARNNPISFRAPTGSLRLGLEFDAPFTRLLERNDYRETLIDYQRSRRAFIQSRDAVHLGLRELLRQIERLRQDLEVQRRAVAIAIRRVDLTRAALYAPVPPPRPGQRAAQFGPTAAFDLLSAQTALRDSQNSFMSVWLNYYAARMRLVRELGIMILDPEGRWIDYPLPASGAVNGSPAESPEGEEVPLPPEIPTEWLDAVRWLPEPPSAEPHPLAASF